VLSDCLGDRRGGGQSPIVVGQSKRSERDDLGSMAMLTRGRNCKFHASQLEQQRKTGRRVHSSGSQLNERGGFALGWTNGIGPRVGEDCWRNRERKPLARRLHGGGMIGLGL